MSQLSQITFNNEKKAEPVYNFDHGKIIDLTPSAVKQVKSFLENVPEAKGKLFRVLVEGGGCSGMQYGFTFDEKGGDDHLVNCDDIQVLVDEQSKTYLNGSVIDYVSDFRGSGFVVKNPLAKASCGCGTSFTV